MEIKDLLFDPYTIIEKRYNGEYGELKTGFKELDLFLNCVEVGGIITIGGRPSMGKTAFTNSLMLNLLKQGKKCLYFSFEYSAKLTTLNLLSNYSEIDSYKLKRGHLYAKDWDSLAETMKSFTNFKLEIIDKYPSLENIKEQIEKIKPEFVFIDYVQLIEYKTKRPRSEAMSIIVNELKTIACDNNCIIFITSQLSRAVESRIDKRPILSDLRDSSGIEEISDLVIFIYRGEYYTGEKDEDYETNKGLTEIIIAKNKSGPIGTVNLVFKAHIPKFIDLLGGEFDVF